MLSAFKTSDIEKGVNALDSQSLDTLMKYIYRGFEFPSEGSSATLLSWHEKVKKKIYVTFTLLTTLTFTKIISLCGFNLGSIGVTCCLFSITLQTSQGSTMQTQFMHNLYNCVLYVFCVAPYHGNAWTVKICPKAVKVLIKNIYRLVTKDVVRKTN